MQGGEFERGKFGVTGLPGNTRITQSGSQGRRMVVLPESTQRGSLGIIDIRGTS